MKMLPRIKPFIPRREPRNALDRTNVNRKVYSPVLSVDPGESPKSQ